ncbi:SemiSWEET transporter [Megalodesulfovibrio paquesii]
MVLFFELVGALAGLLTTTAFLPQALKTWRSKSVRDISLASYVCLVSGVSLWLCYGLLLEAWPIIVANGAALLLQGSILWMKIRYGRAEATE